MLARERITTNNWVLACPHCMMPNWEYIGPKPIEGAQQIRARHFRGIGDVPNPKGTDEILCHFCKLPVLEDTETKG